MGRAQSLIPDKKHTHKRPMANNPADRDPADTTGDWVQLCQSHYDRESDGELVTAPAFAVAEAKDVDPMDRNALPPLYESVDAQSLEEAFFGPTGTKTRRGGSEELTFRYADCRVALRADGWISVYEPQ